MKLSQLRPVFRCRHPLTRAVIWQENSQLSARKSPFSLVAYPDSNSLVVKGSPDQIRYVRQLVQTLDNSRSQVELSLWIIDVVRSKVDDLQVCAGKSGI